MFNLDPKTSARLEERLRREEVIWLTTVRPDGTPIPTPVWFLWEGDSLLVYTLPGSRKLRNIASNPKVAFNLNTNERGGSVFVLTGQIQVENDEPPATDNSAFMDKYRAGIARIGMTPESFASEYSVALRLRPTHVRADA